MRTEERIRAVRRVIDQGETLLDAWAELGDELSAVAEEIADAAYSAGQACVRQRPCR